MHLATLFEKLADQKVRCTACNWYCTIPDGKTGVCGVRKNVNGTLQLLVYGKPIAAHIDPVEKKPLFHFLPGTPIFSIGTIGCNFSCGFCQNWDISQAIRELKKEKKVSEQEIERVSGQGEDWQPEKIVEYCQKNRVPSMAFTYNEPAIFFEYAFDTAKLGKQQKIKSVFVSNGYQSRESIEAIEPYLDAINIDVKSFSEKFYQKNCKAKLEPILKNIQKIAKTKIWMEITTLVIPGENDSDTELKQIAEFLAGVNPDIPWHVTAFHPDYQMLEKDSTSNETLLAAHAIGKKAGLNFVYVGNIMDNEHANTHCPNCQKLLVKRAYHGVLENHVQNGCCSYCEKEIPGVWK